MTSPTGQVDDMAQSTRPVTAAVVTGLLVVLGGFQVLLLLSVLRAWLGPAEDDPHGYTVVLGTVCLLATTPATLLLWSARRRLRARR